MKARIKVRIPNNSRIGENLQHISHLTSDLMPGVPEMGNVLKDIQRDYSPYPPKQFVQGDVQCHGHFCDIIKTYISLTSLNTADVAAIEPRGIGKCFLR